MQPLLWRNLAKSVPGRTNKDCRRRWWNTLAGNTAKGPWSESEDERLIHAVGTYGAQWTQVAAAVGTRHSDQCSSHWTQVLDPDINHSDFTLDEDRRLLQAVKSQGTNWTGISIHHTPRRTTLALKNRYAALQTRLTTDCMGDDSYSSRADVLSAPTTTPFIPVNMSNRYIGQDEADDSFDESLDSYGLGAQTQYSSPEIILSPISPASHNDLTSQRTKKRSITSIESPIFDPKEKRVLSTKNFQSEARDASHSSINTDFAQYGVDVQGLFNRKGNLIDLEDSSMEGSPTCADGRPSQLRKDHASSLRKYSIHHAKSPVLVYTTNDNNHLDATFDATHPGVHGVQRSSSEAHPTIISTGTFELPNQVL
ncbi:hypothetical protein RRF57_003997 [Xylaria bambusicola]|uniref:Uncharacterized protein n=1 Tax=Xylaria bambusicola TaxID=326684 RepID=A0AAN7Z3Z9_9PEZI